MVSNARLDLPEPESPVTTISLSRGISTEMFLRLCTRAPCTAIVVRAEPLDEFRLPFELEAMRVFLKIEESQLLHFNVALPGELNRSRGLADESLIGKVLARRCHTADLEVPLEMVLDLGARPHFANLAEVIEQGGEQCRCALGQILVDRIEG